MKVQGYNGLMRTRAISLVLIFSAVVLGQNSDPKRDPSAIGTRKVAAGPNFYSIEKEMALGRQLCREVEKQAKLLDDPIVTEYVNRVGQNLARHSDVTFPVDIKVLELDQPNAFTLPGGQIYVNTGLIRLSENEAELASAIAHELGHVAARHATRQATQEKIANGASIPLIFMGPVWAATRQAVPLGFLKLSRVYETEADLLGVEYLYETGYDPTAAVDFFERLEAMERKRPGLVGQLFVTHPVTADRIAKTQKMIDEGLPAKAEYVLNTSEYEAIRERVVGLAPKPKEESRPSLRKAGEAEPLEKNDFRP